MTSAEIFKTGIFYGQRNRRMEDQKPWLDLALKEDFAKGRRLKPGVPKLFDEHWLNCTEEGDADNDYRQEF